MVPPSEAPTSPGLRPAAARLGVGALPANMDSRGPERLLARGSQPQAVISLLCDVLSFITPSTSPPTASLYLVLRSVQNCLIPQFQGGADEDLLLTGSEAHSPISPNAFPFLPPATLFSCWKGKLSRTNGTQGHCAVGQEVAVEEVKERRGWHRKRGAG